VPTMIVRPVSTVWTRLLSFVLSLAVVLFAVAPALATSIQTDLWVYQYGDTVNVTGDGFGVTEPVDVVTTDPNGVEVDRGTAQSDDAGYIVYSFTLTSDVAGIYDVVATGQISGLTASTQFDPAPNPVITFPAAIAYNAAGWAAGCMPDGACGTATPGSGGTVTSVQYSMLQVSSGNYWDPAATPAAFSSASEVIIAVNSFSAPDWKLTFQASRFPADGWYTLRILATQTGSTPTTKAATATFTIDRAAPGQPIVASSTPSSPANNNSPTINGTAEAGSTVKLYNSSTCAAPLFGSGTASGGGSFSIAVSPILDNTSYDFYATATDGAGNVSACSATHVPYVEDSFAAAPILSSSTPASPGNVTSPTINGTAEAGSLVKLYKTSACSGSVQGSGTANAITGVFAILVGVATNSTTTFFGKVDTDLAGNTSACSSTSVTYTHTSGPTDTTKPVIAASATANAVAYTAGTWTKFNVVVSFTCTDEAGGSGISTNTVGGSTVSSEGVTASVSNSGTCVDNAGNIANTASFGPIWIDKTAPVISGSRLPLANANGWNNTDVVVSFSCADALSGINAGDNTVAGGTVSTEGANQSKSNTGSCVDKAGNPAAAATVSNISIDKTAPVITAALVPLPNLEGWNHGAVAVHYTCSDDRSGVDPIPGCPADDNISADGTYFLSHAISDLAGNSSSVNLTVKIDASAPTIFGTASPAANGDGWNNSDVTVHFVCLDTGGSGIKSCAGDVLFGEGADQFVTGTAVDHADNSASATVANINVDETPPDISVFSRTPVNANGWNNTDVVVVFACTDGLSGVASLTSPQTVSSEGMDQSASGTCFDRAGNSSSLTVQHINIDKTPPVISGSRLPLANANGWNKTDVTVSFSCADNLGGSGILAADITVAADGHVFGEGAGQSVTSPGSHCVDQAGNPAAPNTVSGINVDETAPIISGLAIPAANANGWNNTDVVVSFSCADALSGILPADNTVVGGTLSAEGAGQSKTNGGSCVDKAGNPAAAATVSGINIDKTPPTVAYTSASPAANANGWRKTDVVATFTATDSLSGFAGPAVTKTGTSTTSGEGASVTVGSPAFTDLAGNTAAANVTASAPFKIDKTAPDLPAFVGGPAAGAHYIFGSVPAAPTCSSADALSGVAWCIVTGYLSTVGTHTMTATAMDMADNSSTSTRSYTVDPWTLSGFFAPVDVNGILNTVKNGSTVPLKFRIFAGSVEQTDVSAVLSVMALPVTCDSGAQTDPIEEIVTTGGTVLRYDGTSGQFIDNWKTPSGGGVVGKCYKVTMTALDGSHIDALFKLK
jgi:hypothetical protein